MEKWRCNEGRLKASDRSIQAQFQRLTAKLPSLRYSPIDRKPLPTLVQGLQVDIALLSGCPKCKSFARNGLDPGAGIGAAGLESGDLNRRRVMDLRSLIVLEAIFESVLWKLPSQYQRPVEKCLLRAVVGQWLGGEAHRKREFDAVARFPHASDGQITAWRAGNLQPLAVDDYESLPLSSTQECERAASTRFRESSRC